LGDKIAKKPLQLLRSLTLTAALSVTVGCGSPVGPTQEDQFPLNSGQSKQWHAVSLELELRDGRAVATLAVHCAAEEEARSLVEQLEGVGN
jgi:hypothetical protein